MHTAYFRQTLARAAIVAIALAAALTSGDTRQAQEAIRGYDAAGTQGTTLAQDTAQVSVVHGIPGQPVDVYANGEAILRDVTPGQIEGPLALPAGTYQILITPPGGNPQTDMIANADGVEVRAGQNLSVVAHLTEAGAPAIASYLNDVSDVPAGQTRVTVRHDAAAPAVDVRANAVTVFSNLTNPNEQSTQVAAGTAQIEVVPTGTDTPVLGPGQLDLPDGGVVILYAVGSADEGNLQLLAQPL